MKDWIVVACLAVILVVVFSWGKSCGTPAAPPHIPQVKAVDSVALAAAAATTAAQRVKDSMAPVMKQLRDSIAVLNKRRVPADTKMDDHIIRIKALSDSLRTMQDSTASTQVAIAELLDELAETMTDYLVQQGIKDSLIKKQAELIVKLDSVTRVNENLQAQLTAALHVTQGAFNQVVADDKKPVAQLGLYKVATKAEALVIAALVLKIALSK